MSAKAFRLNCEECYISWQMQKGKMEFEARPCPTVKGKQLSPFQVREKMPADWKCEAKT